MTGEWEAFFMTGALILSVILGLIVIPNILYISHKKRLFDMPDARKVHVMPIPRLGGISFFPISLISTCSALGFCFLLGMPLIKLPTNRLVYEACFMLIGSTFLFLIGLADDLVGVGYKYKFAVQFIAAMFLVLSGEWINNLGGVFGIYSIPDYIGMPLTVLLVIYIINAINLIDGIDGLASGLSCLALAMFAVIYAIRDEFFFDVLSISIFGIVLVFWFFNVFGSVSRGHKLFMGDSGSLFLGYALSFLVIHLAMAHPMSEPHYQSEMVIAFSTILVPLFDVVRLVFHRIKNHKNPFLPDMNHIHHRLLRTGLRFRQVLVVIILIAVFYVVFNFLLVRCWKVDLNLIIIFDVLVWTIVHYFISYLIKVHDRRKQEPAKL